MKIQNQKVWPGRKQLKVKELASSYAPTNRIQADTQASSHPRQKNVNDISHSWEKSLESLAVEG